MKPGTPVPSSWYLYCRHGNVPNECLSCARATVRFTAKSLRRSREKVRELLQTESPQREPGAKDAG